MQGKDND